VRFIANLSATQVVTRQNGTNDVRIRSTEPILRDGVVIDSHVSKGQTLWDLDLTPAQSEAFRTMLAEGLTLDPEGGITLPDGGERGKPLATGPSLASFVRANDPATESPEARK